MREWLSGRASPCQGECRGFESRFPLQKVRTVFSWRYSQAVRPRSAKPLCPGSNPGGASNKLYRTVELKNYFYLRCGGIGRRSSRKTPLAAVCVNANGENVPLPLLFLQNLCGQIFCGSPERLSPLLPRFGQRFLQCTT